MDRDGGKIALHLVDDLEVSMAMGVPPDHHPNFSWVFPNKNQPFLGYPHFWKPPFGGENAIPIRRNVLESVGNVSWEKTEKHPQKVLGSCDTRIPLASAKNTILFKEGSKADMFSTIVLGRHPKWLGLVDE